MKKILLLTLTIVVNMNSFAQANWQWGTQMYSTSNYDGVAEVRVTDNGLYVFGRTGNSVTVAPLGATPTPGGGAGLYVARLNKVTGAGEWVDAVNANGCYDYPYGMNISPNQEFLSIAGLIDCPAGYPQTLLRINNPLPNSIHEISANGARGKGVAVDDNGNRYLCGEFNGSTFTMGTQVVTNSAGGGTWDMFVAKMDSLGNCLWMVSGGGSGFDNAVNLNLSPTGDLWFASYSTSSDASYGTFNTPPATGTQGDVVMGRLDTLNGNFIDVVNIPNAGYTVFNNHIRPGMTTDSCGNLYLTGFYDNPNGSAIFGSHTLTPHPLGTGRNGYVAKYSVAQQNWLWAKQINSDAYLGIYDIDLNENNDRIYISGDFRTDLTFNGCDTLFLTGGVNDQFLASFDMITGEFLWADAGFSGPGNQSGRSISVEDNGSIYTSAGAAAGNIPLLGGISLGTPAGTGDGYVGKFEDDIYVRTTIINLTHPSDVSYCPFDLGYDITGIFNGSNSFTVEIDAIGNDFNSPTSLGSINSNSAGTITSLVPGTIPPGTYDIRVISTCPGLHSGILNIVSCDSFSYIYPQITVLPSYDTTLSINACENSTLTYPDGTTAVITSSTSYTSTLVSVAGCDSIIVTNVTMDPIYTLTVDTTVCAGANYTYPDGTTSTNITVNESNVSTMVSVSGCDSLVTTNINVGIEYSLTQDINTCENTSITYPDGTTAMITASGSYSSNLTTVAGCDSIIVTNVTMYVTYDISESATICSGEDYTYPDGTLHSNILASESYISTFTSISGCDSSITTILTVTPTSIVTAGVDQSVCDGELVMLNASGALNYAWDNGVTNGLPFIQSSPSVTYTVTGTDANGCTSTDDVVIYVNPAPDVLFSASALNGCAPLEVTITNLTVPTGVNCEWTFGDGTSTNGCGPVTTIYNTVGLYNVGLTVTTADGCVSNAYYVDYINVFEPPNAIISADNYHLDLDDTEVQFYNNSNNADSYQWHFGDESSSFEEEPTHEYPEIGNVNYDVVMIASNAHGCSDTAYLNIVIEDLLVYYVPNAFTPTGDSYNQTFQPVFTSGYDPNDYHLAIFNRWGELIFESYNPAIGWDGTYGNRGIIRDGVYIWKIDFKENMTDKRHEEMGHVTLLK